MTARILAAAVLVAWAATGHAQGRGEGRRPPPPGTYSIEQATSDRAQLHTIAFDGLAFLTGDFARDTFLPPGKVSDYFGFQYMRDIDVAGLGHNTSFLTRIAQATLAVLDDAQKGQLVALARAQEGDIVRFAEMRWPLIQAFRRNLEGDLPAGTSGLDPVAVRRHSADLYALDGKLAYERARVMARVLRSLDARQRAALDRMKFGDSRTWPVVAEQLDRRALSHEVDVAVMTYASEMFACLAEIVTTRRAIATELRRFLRGEEAEEGRVLALSRRYGELDGAISLLYATGFAKVGRSLAPEERRRLARLRSEDPSAPRGPFLYSTPVRARTVDSTKFFARAGGG